MAIEAEELATISRSIRSAGQETAGEFRQAANASNASLARIVKDISTTFKAQREDIADLHNVLEEMVSESQQTANKIDSLNALFRESLEIQNAIQTQISNVSRNTRILSSDIENLNRNIMNNTAGTGLLGSITGIGKDVASQLLAMGVGAVAGAGTMTAVSSLGGGGGTTPSSEKTGTSNFQWGMGPENLNMKAAAEAIKDIESKGSGGYLAKAPGSSASGAYQFIDETWRNASTEAGYKDKYKTARDAPPEVQDAVFNSFFQKLVKQHGLRGAVLTYFTGNPQGKLTAAQQRNNITPESYISKFEKGYQKHVGESKPQESTSPVTPSNDITTTTGSSTTSGSMVPSAQETVPSAADPRTERIGKEGGHGPISGATPHETPHGMDVSKVKLIERYGPGRPERPDDSILNIAKKAAAATGMESITATSGKGNYISPSGLARGQKTTMHSTGLAVDVVGFSDDKQKLEFIKNAKAAGAKGVGVYNNGSVHIDLGRERSWNWGMKDDAGFKAALGSGATASAQGDITPNVGPTLQTSISPQQTPSLEQPQAAPVEQSPVSPGIAAPVSTPNMSPMMGMMGGGIGGIAGMLLPMISSTIQSELVSTPSMPALNTQTVNQAAVTSQAMEQSGQEAQSSFYTPQVNPESNRMAPGDNSGFAYNMPADIGWPDWAGMIGGMHWEEMKNYKKNMAWG